MKFRLKADVVFEVEDIEDAFRKLRDHFDMLSKASDESTESFSLFTHGHIELCKESTGGRPS